jgi:CRISPR type I-E-associated protein CasA/Cse1
VSECYYAQGRSVTENLKSDPLLAYRVDKEKGNLVWQLRKDRAVWRDSSALFSLSDQTQASRNFRPALSINLLNVLVAKGILKKERQYQLNIYGQNLDPGQPKINFWRHERLPLPLDYLADESLVEDLQAAMEECEGAEKALRYALRHFATGMLASPEGKPDRDAVTNLASHLGADKLFWSRLETHFYHLLKELPNARNEALDAWADRLHHTCWNCFAEATRDLDSSARTLQSIVEARQMLGGGLKRVLE